MFGRANLGEGALKTEGIDIVKLLVFNTEALQERYDALTEAIGKLSKREIRSIYNELGINPALLIREQKPNPFPDRKALDDVVFDILGLTQDERNEVYWAVCELVKNRLDKAKSV